jgi:crotonobetainyl-CoA:carnitine CoA-transferase CaiB-like acyl-CoA transferase
VGRTLAEHGANVLCATRPNDYEHEFIYAEANVGSGSAYIDLATPTGQDRAATLLASADVVVNNHRSGTLERHGLAPLQLAERYRAWSASRSPAMARAAPGHGAAA